MCWCCFFDFLIFIGGKVYYLLMQWPFIVLLTILIYKKQISTFIMETYKINFSKYGVEFEKIKKDAEKTINDTQQYSVIIFIPLVDALARDISLNSIYTIKNKFDVRNGLNNYIKENKILDENLKSKVCSLNDSILHDVIYSMTKSYETTAYPYDRDILQYFETNNSFEDFNSKPDMLAIEKFLVEKDLIQIDYIKYIWEEAKYFSKYSNFKNIDKLINSMLKAQERPV